MRTERMRVRYQMAVELWHAAARADDAVARAHRTRQLAVTHGGSGGRRRHLKIDSSRFHKPHALRIGHGSFCTHAEQRLRSGRRQNVGGRRAAGGGARQMLREVEDHRQVERDGEDRHLGVLPARQRAGAAPSASTIAIAASAVGEALTLCSRRAAASRSSPHTPGKPGRRPR